jgi:hypothetical protein
MEKGDDKLTDRKDMSDHDLLIRLDVKMDGVIQELKNGNKCMDDHEKKLDVLFKDKDERVGAEKNVIKIAGLVAFIISTVMGAVAVLFIYWHG